ncbi:hypothetical protein [Polynucleobacter sp. TUM22923]|nr:hypothetical protein [Polynucleobacter sp. TUM22923]
MPLKKLPEGSLEVFGGPERNRPKPKMGGSVSMPPCKIHTKQG